MNRAPRVVLGVLTIVAVAACASGVLRPEHWLTWRIEDFRSAQASDDVLWTYSLVLENRGRLAVQIVRGFATTVIGSAQASPEQMITSATISSGELLRVPHAVLIRGSDFNLTDRTATRVVKWQFWTKYADGHSEILHADVRP